MKKIITIALGLIIAISSFGQDKEIEYTLYLFGDAGEPLEEKGRKNIEIIKKKLAKEGENSMLLLTGDNVYPIGIPDASHDQYEESIKKLNALVNMQSDYKGRVLFIPGNHDWEQGAKNGLGNVNRQEDHVTRILGEDAFLPARGCPGPVLIELSDRIIMIVIDTQWILHPHVKPGKDDGCKNGTPEEVYAELQEMIDNNKEKTILVSAHHPLQTYGPHGGMYNFRQHVFPLTEVSDPLWIPLPIIGSIYPMYRKWFGDIQDTAHPKYKEMKRNLEEIFSSHFGLIHVAGHEHSLQYSLYQNVHYVVAGSATKNSPVKLKGNARYAVSDTGYARIVFYKDGTIELEMWPNSIEEPTVFYLN